MTKVYFVRHAQPEHDWEEVGFVGMKDEMELK